MIGFVFLAKDIFDNVNSKKIDEGKALSQLLAMLVGIVLLQYFEYSYYVNVLFVLEVFGYFVVNVV